MGAFCSGVCLWRGPEEDALMPPFRCVTIHHSASCMLTDWQQSKVVNMLQRPVNGRSRRFLGAAKATRQEANASLPLTSSGVQKETQKKTPDAAFHSKTGPLQRPT